MFGLLNVTEIFGLQQTHENHPRNIPRRSLSNASDTGKSPKFSDTLKSTRGMKSPSNFIEKFIKTELLNGYDSLKNYTTLHHSTTPASAQSANSSTKNSHNFCSSSHAEGLLLNVNCLHGSYRSNSDGEFYEAVNVNPTKAPPTGEMTIKCSKNLLSEVQQTSSPATLQNYQKLPDYMEDLTPAAGMGDVSGDGSTTVASNLTSSSVGNLYKKLSFGSRSAKNMDVAQVQAVTNEVASDNSSSSISTTTTQSSANATNLSLESTPLERSSSASSSGECNPKKERKKCVMEKLSPTSSPATKISTPERGQRRRLLQMISNSEQQKKLLQLELAKEKRRRTEELACVVKSLICFESKLKTDMKRVNQRLMEKDHEICRLVGQNRALRKQLSAMRKIECDNIKDEGVVEDDEPSAEAEAETECDKDGMEDCMLPEALKCMNCSKQFYDIDFKESRTTSEGNRKNIDHTTEHGSSSDDTASSSFYGARRSVRYTSKRTSGTFRDYMRSRSMNIDDPALDDACELKSNSGADSQRSYETMNIYSRTIERMHGVKCESEAEAEQSMSSKASEHSLQLEDDDGIFSPQDDLDEELESRPLKIVQRRSMEFSEASPKQVYETSTDDWYASASDPEEIGANAAKTYLAGAVNPVLECVNQILLQQTMEESLQERKTVQTRSPSQLQATSSLPRRSSLSGRRSSRSNSHSSEGQTSRNGTLTRKRVHFSTENNMVHVPRNDEEDDGDEDEQQNVQLQPQNDMISKFSPPQTQQQQQQQHYHPMNYFPQAAQQATTHQSNSSEQERMDTLNYESIYSNEYEPIGSHNSSNLYVDMESTSKTGVASETKLTKLPPALPPKPANLLKFKKSLHQLDEMPDEHLQQDCTAPSVAASEPDYCSISEVNVGITSVQIVADVHKAPESEADLELASQPLEAPASVFDLDVEVSTVHSDDTCAVSQKTEEIEEIFADIPKLPNVAAIIAPKHPKIQKQSDYLVMSPKLQPNASATLGRSPKTPIKLNLQLNSPQQQYKRKHVPNILAEINKRMSLPHSPTQPMVLKTPTPTKSKVNNAKNLLPKNLDELPLQAEFDWYNLDAEYGKATSPRHTPDLLKGNDTLNGTTLLAEIHEDHEGVVDAADEYKLDEEFTLACEKDEENVAEEEVDTEVQPKIPVVCEALNIPLIKGSRTKKIKNNLANFEKFIEGSGLSTKPLPTQQPTTHQSNSSEHERMDTLNYESIYSSDAQSFKIGTADLRLFLQTRCKLFLLLARVRVARSIKS